MASRNDNKSEENILTNENKETRNQGLIFYFLFITTTVLLL